MELNYTNVYNFEGAFRGMRAPMNSWDKSDSIFTNDKTVVIKSSHIVDTRQ